ncbi:MAG: hypothetical protein ACM3NQ_15725 [Bacteroidales bacterium]
MPQAVNLVVILALGAAPLYAALRRSRWPPTQAKWLMVAIPVLLFPLNAPIHEASHIVGTWLMGGAIGQVRLWQPFWKSDAPVAMIETSGLATPTAAFVASVFPYVTDIALLAFGFVLLRRPRIRSAWRFGAFFLFLVLKPSFDITANVVAGSVYGIGDFSQMAGIVGEVWATALEASLLTGAIILTLAVMRAYGSRDEATAPPCATL